MNIVLQYIRQNQAKSTISKHDQIIMGIEKAILAKDLKKGDLLPSVNIAVDGLGYARKTIVSAYDDLKERGIIEARKRLGYFVVSEEIVTTQKVMLLLNAFNPYQEVLYNSILENLDDENIITDVYFHHGNEKLFSMIIDNQLGKYAKYVVTPFESKKVKHAIAKIDPQKLLLIARDTYSDNCNSCVIQNFDQQLENALETGKTSIARYVGCILVYTEKLKHPKGIKLAFERFCKKNSIPYQITEKINNDKAFSKGKVYLVIEDAEMIKCIDYCDEHKLKLGKDVGLISYNDAPVKRLIKNGITSVSTDFKLMGKETAGWILSGKPIKKVIDTTLIIRNSL